MIGKTEEDEAFEEIERINTRKRPVSISSDLNPYETMVRNKTIDEIADRLEQEFKIPFAQDTVASFAAWIREMKRETK